MRAIALTCIQGGLTLGAALPIAWHRLSVEGKVASSTGSLHLGWGGRAKLSQRAQAELFSYVAISGHHLVCFDSGFHRFQPALLLRQGVYVLRPHHGRIHLVWEMIIDLTGVHVSCVPQTT